MNQLKRASGILLHPTSLPSRYGIGDLGKEAYDFVDFLADAGQSLWQILPLTHTGFGDSPYQSFSAFAGQPLLISPAYLQELGLVSSADLADCPVGDETQVDYGTIIPWKTRIFKLAYQNFLKELETNLEWMSHFTAFCEAEAFWLYDYALFMALKDAHDGKSWLEWNDEYQRPTTALKDQFYMEHEEEVDYYQFLQYLFFIEWGELKTYANDAGIKIIGDIPIFVSMDSADVWANQHLFQLDSKGYPLVVAGVPPDYFSATGQLWGNPLYDWEAHKKEGFAWWIRRIQSQLNNLDILRIDHFRGFEAYWAVPYGDDTAINGQWIKAPGHELFTAIQKALGDDLPIIAEDLGTITPEVEELRDAFHFPGMKILHFALNNLGENGYLPHQFTNPNCVCYTGTHDNDTTVGWFSDLDEACQKKTLRYVKASDASNIHWDLVELALSSIAAYAIFPLQDVLGCGKEGRMNTPGEAIGNWSWRYTAADLTSETAEKLKEFTLLYGRKETPSIEEETSSEVTLDD